MIYVCRSNVRLLKILYKFINWYTQHFKFPHRGFKYFYSILRLAHLDQKVFIKKLPGGQFMYVNVRDHIQKNIFWYGYYQKEFDLTWISFIKPNSIILDIGANIGYYSVLAS